MQEIKYRAWILPKSAYQQNKMLYTDNKTLRMKIMNKGYCLLVFIKKKPTKRYNNLWLGIKNTDAILMRYTRFKDKTNNKEIYERDIVKVKIKGQRKHFTYIVEWSQLNGKWVLIQPKDKNGNCLDGIYTDGIDGQNIWKCKVVGNIYQHPHLLK